MLNPTVHIMLATFQGAAFLREQLESLSAQSYANWKLYVSDDRSTDETNQIIIEFKNSIQQKVFIYEGPGRGSTHNFFRLIGVVETNEPGDLYAFCDQDDVWLPDKLANAVAHHAGQGLTIGQPRLYCGRTIVVDQLLKPHGFTAIPRKPLGFGNALLQNIAGGNTMVFNQPLLQILRLISPEHSVLHDWTTYQAATGCGGLVYFDGRASVQYRQHMANVVGSNAGWTNRILRLQFLLKGGYKRWSLQTLQAMHQISPHLTAQSLATLREFDAVRSTTFNPYHRLRLAISGKYWRQSRMGQASFAFALLLNLI